MSQRTKTVWAVVIGIGVALSPIHNRWLTQLTTNDAGETLFFLPAFGYLVWIMGAGLFVLYHWDDVGRTGWGDRKVAVPLGIIVVAIAVSGANENSIQDKVAPLCMGVSLLGLYLVTRIVGRDLLLPLAIGSATASIGVIVSAVWLPGMLTGGLVFEHNYDIIVGFVLLGAILYTGRWKLPLLALALVAILLSGSPEAVFSVFVVSVTVLVRRDWSRRLMWTLVPVVLVGALWFGLGYGQQLYSYTIDIVQGKSSVPRTLGNVPVVGFNVLPDDPIVEPPTPEQNAIGHRLSVIRRTVSTLKPLGEGYVVTAFSKIKGGNVHNVPLVIVQQLGWPGILAGLCWLWVSVWCLVKARRKYLWVLVLALSVFDHYMWTQIGHWWWVAVGVSTAQEDISTDLLFTDKKGGRGY